MLTSDILKTISREDTISLHDITIDEALRCNKEIGIAEKMLIMSVGDNDNYESAMKRKLYWEKQRDKCVRLGNVCINLAALLARIEAEEMLHQTKEK